jgi:hypothetical protein
MRMLTFLALCALTACGDAETSSPEAAPAAAEKAEMPAEKSVKKKKKKKTKVSKGVVPEGAKVFFVEPADGAELSSPVMVKFGLEGMEVKPAGQLDEGTGHHHIVIGAVGVAGGEQVPSDDTHIHYGGGQTEAELELEPGEYSLTMQFADGNHISYGPQMSATIKVTVK